MSIDLRIGWQYYEISDLVLKGMLFIGDGYRAKNGELDNIGLPFARAGNINDGFQFQDADRFPEEILGRVGNKIRSPGDVVFTSKGTVGRLALVTQDTPRFVYSPQLCFWRVLDNNKIDPRFMYFWMFSREFFLQNSGAKGQTDMADYVGLKDQRQMHITLPPLTVQLAIARIPGSLDDKIEANRRMNETLEAIARAIFKSWFVDFDPARAKAEGREPAGMDAETMALFPDGFEEANGRIVPRGWRFGAVADLGEIVCGKTPPTSEIADYIGLAYRLRSALRDYTESGGTGKTAIDLDEAVSVMLEKYEICRGLFHGFDWFLWTSGTSSQKLSLLPPAREHILKQEDGKSRLLKAVTDLSAAFALAVPHDRALEIRDDVGFFQAVRSALAKSSASGQRAADEFDLAIQQLVSKAITPDGVVDIFAAAGLNKPDISILSDEFLAEVRGMPQRNLAVELLRKLLNDEIKTRSKRNLVLSRSFAEMLEKSVHAYQIRSIEAAQVLEELIDLAKEMREANKRGEDLGLSEDELAFYDALEVNDSAVKILGDETLQKIAKELVEAVRKNVSIDWTVKESARAKLRVIVRRLLRKYGYPPDKQEKATQTVLEQAELMCKEWVF